MKVNITDLDELVLSCRTPEAKKHISEAVACYYVGAYRACIVSTWIAVLFDIISKIEELASTGDKAAESLVNEFHSYRDLVYKQDKAAMKKALQFENDLLPTAQEKLELLTHQQYTDLLRLREDRNRCAHPSFQDIGDPYTPTAELVRCHMRHAVEHILCRPPIQGKIALQELKQRIQGNYFPCDLDKAINNLQHSPLSNAKPALICTLIYELIIMAKDEPFKEYQFSIQNRTVVAILVCFRLYSDIARSKAIEVINNHILKASGEKLSTIMKIAFELHLLSDLNEAAIDMMRGYIERGPEDEVIKILGHTVGIQNLAECTKIRMFGLPWQYFTKAIYISFDSAAKPKEEPLINVIIERASKIDRFRRVQDQMIGAFWQADIIAQCLVRFLPYLTREHIAKIVEYAIENDQLHKGGSMRVLTEHPHTRHLLLEFQDTITENYLVGLSINAES